MGGDIPHLFMAGGNEPALLQDDDPLPKLPDLEKRKAKEKGSLCRIGRGVFVPSSLPWLAGRNLGKKREKKEGVPPSSRPVSLKEKRGAGNR